MTPSDTDKGQTTVAKVVRALSPPKEMLSSVGKWTIEGLRKAISERGLTVFTSDADSPVLPFDLKMPVIACIFYLHMPDDVSDTILKDARFTYFASALLRRRHAWLYQELIKRLNAENVPYDESELRDGISRVLSDPATLALMDKK